MILNIVSGNDFQSFNRVYLLTQGLNLFGSGLEIAPFHRPTLRKCDYDIYYTDYATKNELLRKHAHLPTFQQIQENIVDVDFIWVPGSALADSCRGKMFDYVIASHVIEHVPNMIGWISQILSVLKTGGVLSLAVPDKRCCFDAYRSLTEVSELIDLWIRDQKIPGPAQIFDMLSNSADLPVGVDMPCEKGIPFDTLHRNYTDKEALEFAFYAYRTGSYLDIHCSVFTPESLKRIFVKLCDLGILNVQVSDPIVSGSEFFIQLTKLGEPQIRRI